MARPSRSTYHHGDLRRTLVAQACETLEREGLEALSLRGIAARAGVSHNAPYRHFPDRAALLAAAAREGFADLTARLRAAGGDGGPGRAAAAGRAYLAFAQARPQMYRLMFSSDLIRPPSGPDPELAAVSRETYAAFAEAAAGAVPPGAGAEPGAVAALMWAPLHGLAMLLLDRRLQPWMREGTDDAALQQALAAALPAFADAAARSLART